MDSRTQITVPSAPLPVSLVRWGPLLAGLAVTLATGWLLSTIGTALGLSIADARDIDTATAFKGLGIGVVAWMFFSWAAAFFIGGSTTGRLLATPDDTLGKVHGFTLWSTGTVLWIFVALIGATGFAAAGASVVSGAAKLTAGAVGVAGAGAGAAAKADPGAAEALLAPLSNRIQAEFKTAATETVSKPGPDGAAVSPDEVRGALEDVDAETLTAASAELIAGRPDGARHVLTSRTSLDAEQVDTIVTGVSGKVQREVDQVKAKLEIAAQRAVDFAQAALWVMAAGALIGLAACMLGGAIGARCAARHSSWASQPLVTATTVSHEPSMAHT